MSTNLRITGLMSGLDTESMIESLMKAERVKVDTLKQDRQLVLWRQEMYNNLNKEFANFIINTRKNFGLTYTTSTGIFLSNSYKNLSWVKRVTSSDTSIASVSASGIPFDGIYRVNVEKIAQGVSMVSGSNIGGDLKDILASLGEDDEIRFTIATHKGEKEFVFRNESEKKLTVEDIVKELNSATVLDENNKEVSLGIKASYDANIGRFFIQTKETGRNVYIKIDADEGTSGKDFIEALNLKVSYNGYEDSNGNVVEADGTGHDLALGTKYIGQDALIHFNGAENITSSSNNITINGINMSLMGTGEFTVTVNTDVDGIYQKISSFIEEYNKLVDKVDELLKQKRYYDYKPLTDAQKEEMKDKEIELWEEKAKSGLLKNDDIIARTMQNIRSSIYEEFEGVFKLITEIGITTEKYASGTAGGRLEIKDEQKLRQAISENPEGVMELLFKESSEESAGGIVTRIYDNLISGMEEIIKKSGTGDNASLYRNVKSTILLDFVTEYGSISLLDKSIADYDKRIADLNDALRDKENYYYKKFAALETAISRMNAQSMWLAQQFNYNNY
ncbi:MAG TPA: flagellar filament capping protein FliD [Tissierellia bacterium]|nr:flagellar filament capping protein FliD [Tissierellia bacterium]